MNHLLIVDDSPVDRALARKIVEQHTSLFVEFAGNGVEAIERLEAAAPLAVLTDLQMPEMDGLALVRAARQRYPTIPVVLMTAYGSEEIALEALVAGAADYIPKVRLATDLPRVLDSVLGTLVGDHRHGALASCLQYEQLRYLLVCDVVLIPPLVDRLQQVAADLGLIDQPDRVRLAHCLAEAVRNAMTHGSTGGAANGSTGMEAPLGVFVSAEFTPTQARFVIRDQGPGFDPAEVADPRHELSCLSDGSGRGLSLIRLFMDDVSFNEAGNEITLLMRKRTAHIARSVPLANAAR